MRAISIIAYFKGFKNKAFVLKFKQTQTAILFINQ